MRRHIVGGGPDADTGKTTIVIEDPALTKNHIRLECAHSDVDFAYAVKTIEEGRLRVDVSPRKGHPRHTLHMVVSPDDYDTVVALMEDDDVTPMSDQEFASELMRATRRNN